jgi:hypothetical protein
MSDRELESFKRVDLREYAAKEDYVLDKRESWRGSTVMRKGGDKVIVKRDGDGHYVYFSVRDKRDNGSIIDFVQHRKHLSLGAVRQELRPWIGESAQAALPLFPALPTTGKDRMRVETEYARMQEAPAGALRVRGEEYRLHRVCRWRECRLDRKSWRRWIPMRMARSWPGWCARRAHEPSSSKDWNDKLRAGVRQESKSRYLKVLVCGGRDFHDTKRVDEVLCKYAPSVVIHGCARGADTLASIWASQHGVQEMKFFFRQTGLLMARQPE